MTENSTNFSSISGRNSRYAIYLKIKNILEQRSFAGVPLGDIPRLPKRSDFFGLKNYPTFLKAGRFIRGKLFPKTTEQHRQNLYDRPGGLDKPKSHVYGKYLGRAVRFAVRQILRGSIPGTFPTATGSSRGIRPPDIKTAADTAKAAYTAIRGGGGKNIQSNQSSGSEVTNPTTPPTTSIPSSRSINVPTPIPANVATENIAKRLVYLHNRARDLSLRNISGLPTVKQDLLARRLQLIRGDIKTLTAATRNNDLYQGPYKVVPRRTADGRIIPNPPELF